MQQKEINDSVKEILEMTHIILYIKRSEATRDY